MSVHGNGQGRQRGLLIVGHGTRDPEGLAGFAETVQAVRSRLPHRPVESCFLELAAPTIAEGVARLSERGVRQFDVLPLMLFAAGHVQRDIPAAVAQASAPYPTLESRQLSHLGCHPRLLQLSALRHQDALAGLAPLGPRESLLLLVGRGNRQPSALAEMNRFAELRQADLSGERVQVCFASMADPLLIAILPRLARSPVGRIVVQPHLLFAGELATRIRTTVKPYLEDRNGPEWVFAEPLGPHPLLVGAMVEIAEAGLDSPLGRESARPAPV